MVASLSRTDVLRSRLAAQQLDREHGSLADTAVLDLGVQDTGPDGARWALAVRGVEPDPDELVSVWTLRGAPHVYRRADLPSVAAAVAPFSDADAGKRISGAAKPLRAAGIGGLEALDATAAVLRELVRAPMVKGDVSGALSRSMPEPYLRDCRPCGSRHVHEMPFRLAALRAGLELQPGTSPPVLTPVAGFAPADSPEPRHDVVRAVLRLLGPLTPEQVAGYLDAPVADVAQRWPGDAVEVDVEGQRRWQLGDPAPAAERPLRLLGPFDPYLQARDRQLLVADRVRARSLWPALGRPGAVLAGGELAGLWRPRASGSRVRLEVELWQPVDRAGLDAQAERLAAVRGSRLAGVEVSG